MLSLGQERACELLCAALDVMRARTAAHAVVGDTGALAEFWAQWAPALLTDPGASAVTARAAHAASCVPTERRSSRAHEQPLWPARAARVLAVHRALRNRT